MMNMVKISVIMPLYNAANYLEECLESVLRQTFTEFELICIDDASTDATAEILRRYQKKDSRIAILTNNKRSGAAYSRNRGMKDAGGQYLAFLDGDDIFDENMYSAAYQSAIEHSADIVMYEYRHVPSDLVKNKQKVFHSEQYRKRYCRQTFSVVDHEPSECLNWGLSPCNKLYRREFVENYQLNFQNLPSSNDVYFVCMALMLSKRNILLDDVRVMVYARDHEEPTRISSDRDPKCAYQAFLQIEEELIKRGVFAELYACFYYRFFNAMKSALQKCSTIEKEKDFYQFLRKEGIDRICSMSGEYYDKLDAFIRNAVEQFKTQDFTSGWYTKETGLMLQLSSGHNADAVTGLFRKYQESHKKVGIWGVGANGISLLQFCREHGLQVDMVIDGSQDKQGRTVEGYQIMAPEDINGQLQVVVVSARHICESVAERVSKWNIEVVDLNQFLFIY